MAIGQLHYCTRFCENLEGVLIRGVPLCNTGRDCILSNVRCKDKKVHKLMYMYMQGICEINLTNFSMCNIEEQSGKYPPETLKCFNLVHFLEHNYHCRSNRGLSNVCR